MANIQQRLFSSCQNPIDPNNPECLVLKHILDELKAQDKRYLVDAEDGTNRSPIFHAIECEKPLHYLRLLLEFPVRLTSRVLLCAIRHGNIDLLELLHEYGADFRQTHHGLSLLHECILLHKNHLIRFLIDKGEVNLNAVDHDNQTPLLYAVYRTNIEAIHLLLSYSTIDPCQLRTRSKELTSFHVACELGIDEVLPSMIKYTAASNINQLSKHDQTPFDLFLSCYLFTKNNLYMTEASLKAFSSLFDRFVANGAMLHHLTKAYRRTRAPYVTKILNILWKKKVPLSSIILETGRSTIIADLQLLVCQSLGDWPYLVESNDSITWKQRQLILRELYELFTSTYWKSPNKQMMNEKLVIRHCSANGKDSRIKQTLWLFIRSFIEPDKEPNRLKAICRKQLLLHLSSIDQHCAQSHLYISKGLEEYLLFFQMD